VFVYPVVGQENETEYVEGRPHPIIVKTPMIRVGVALETDEEAVYRSYFKLAISKLSAVTTDLD